MSGLSRIVSLAGAGIAGGLLLGFAAACREDKTAARPAVPAIVHAANTHQVVLIGEEHGSTELHDFFRALLREESVREVVDDVVVEFGNHRYQRLMDAYIQGRPVPVAKVRHAWESTAQGSVWLAPPYEAFFRAIRARNRELPPELRLRVVLGDPPISPAQIADHRMLDFFILQRDQHFASVIQREVIARGRKAIVVAGASHVVRRPSDHPTLANLLEQRARCETDPVAVSAGIDWCDDVRRHAAVTTYVVVPEAIVDRVDLIEEGWRSEPPSIAPLAATELGRTASDDWRLEQAADALLLLGER